MEKLTRLTDPGQQTTNTQVMGITNENKIFEGIVIDVISYDGMVPSVMTVEGRTYDGNMFVEELPHLMDTTPVDGFGKIHSVRPAIVSFVDVIDS